MSKKTTIIWGIMALFPVVGMFSILRAYHAGRHDLVGSYGVVGIIGTGLMLLAAGFTI